MSAQKKNIPIVELVGTVFEVDVQNNVLRQKDQPDNQMSFNEMVYCDTHYKFLYDSSTKNHAVFGGLDKDMVFVECPQKVELDAEGMARKYNLSLEQVKGKSDFDLMVDQGLYAQRVKNGKLPLITICGHEYIVDIRIHELRSSTDLLNRIDLRKTYEVDEGRFQFFYAAKSHQFIDLHQHTGSLKGIVEVTLPSEVQMDPYALARDNNLNIKEFLIKHPISKELTASVKPIEKNLARAIMKSNKAKLLEKNQNGDHKRKGKHL